MATKEDVIEAACVSLEALAAHVATLSAGDFATPVPALAGASIGQHVRHCLEHFVAVDRGLATGRFDYDARERAAELEHDPARAALRARQLAGALRRGLAADDLERAVRVRAASSVRGEVSWQASSLARELQFLVSHTVHHAAMIAACCRILGLPVADEHGVAPSTLRHRGAAAR